MDEIAQKANQARSSRGNIFERKIEELLGVMLDKKKIKGFERSPKVYDGEFNPDFIISTNKGDIICVDSTTTARTNRLRGKQWDAHGTKMYFLEKKRKKIIALVVIQDHDTNEKEKANFRRCKMRVTLPHSALDKVVSVKEFMEIVEKN